MHLQSTIVLAAWVTLATANAAVGQSLRDPLNSADRSSGGLIDQFDRSNDIGLDPARVSAKVAPATADRPAVLMITAKIASGRHTYSITQPPGGPLPTKIELDPSRDYRIIGPFVASPPPHTRVELGPVWTGLEIQEHEGEVTWYAPIEITAGVDPAALDIKGDVHLEVCQTGGYCEPVDRSFAAKLSSSVQLSSAIENELQQSAIGDPTSESTSAGRYQSDTSEVKLTGRLIPAAVRPGESARLEFTAALPAGGRIYVYADRDDKKGTKPVLIAIDRATGLVPHRPSTNAPVKTDDSVPQFGPMQYYEGAVTWSLRVEAPKNAPAGEYAINGLLGYQSCEYRNDGKNICELPHAVRFAATLQVGKNVTETVAPISFTSAEKYSDVARLAETYANYLDGQFGAAPTNLPVTQPPQDNAILTATNQYDLDRVQVEDPGGSLAYYIALALVGGLILNLMPCVLPVIGLKVMSFVEQSGKSRAHALILNLWYGAGIVSVFILLGILAATIGLTWGGQFGSTTFNVTIAAVVFAMALSLLGVWEIPVPGFFGSGSVQSAAAQEGPLGAFLKGVVTTVLATPCTAPFAAAALAWAVTQPLATTLIVFASLGIGMASPYILVGMYPELLRFLPKPGRWMETFKQISGFVLMATVVFILYFVEPAAVIPLVLLLLGIGVACWFLGRTSLAAERRELLQSWATAGTIVLIFVAVSFGWLYRDVMQPRFANIASAGGPASHGPWQPFSLERLKQVAVDSGKTVLVDFSAEWCLNCKALELAVLHTNPVESAIDQAEVVTMYADYTHYPAEIARTIKALRANGVPVIAVFPGDSPYRPIVFRGSYTQKGLIQALEKATGQRLQSAGQSVAEASAGTPAVN